MSAAEQAFEEWWIMHVKGYDIFPTAEAKTVAKAAYRAATERTARRCADICQTFNDDTYKGDWCEDDWVDMAAEAIAKEFGLD